MPDALKHPDIQEAFRNARLCQPSQHDSLFARMSTAVTQVDPNLARAFISEIRNPGVEISVQLELCLTTFALSDIQGMEQIIPSCKKNPELWVSVCRAVRLFAEGQLPQAREACDDIRDLLLLIKLRVFFARRTNLAEDIMLLGVATAILKERLEERIGVAQETLGDEFLYIAKSDAPYWTARLEWLKLSRKARLTRLIDLQVPTIVISNEICMIAETGDVDFALQAVKQNDITLDTEDDEYNHHFSIGYSRLHQNSKARELAEKVRDPEKRALAYVNLYLAGLNN